MTAINLFERALRDLGATPAEITELADTDMDGVIDEAALAHERLASLRGVSSIDVNVDISRLVEIGREHEARERFGDERVDAWFRADGVDPDASRAGW
ncbi:MAG TPA: hypothetical protein VN803_06370 [Gemmatimonadales bacterium]|nr:hypothetical protein [Gemmatimonadales bacterium]